MIKLTRNDPFVLLVRTVAMVLCKRMHVPQLILALLFTIVSITAQTVPDTSKTVLKLSDPRVRFGFVFCNCAPSTRGFSSTAKGILAKELEKLIEKVINETNISTAVQAIEQEAYRSLGRCVEKSSYESCINADASLRKVLNRSMCNYDKTTGKNVAYNNGDTVVTLGQCNLAVQYRDGSHSSNEGCVAVEHLIGYQTLHPRDLNRYVLCMYGFCATPNHAIIVHETFTSMKLLCGSVWNCTSRMGLVNNIKVWQNTRVRVSDLITISPYDIRYSRCAIWIAQIVSEFTSPIVILPLALLFASFHIPRMIESR